MKAYLWSTNDGNASWTDFGREEPRQGTKRRVAKLQVVLLLVIIILIIILVQ